MPSWTDGSAFMRRGSRHLTGAGGNAGADEGHEREAQAGKETGTHVRSMSAFTRGLPREGPPWAQTAEPMAASARLPLVVLGLPGEAVAPVSIAEV